MGYINVLLTSIVGIVIITILIKNIDSYFNLIGVRSLGIKRILYLSMICYSICIIPIIEWEINSWSRIIHHYNAPNETYLEYFLRVGWHALIENIGALFIFIISAIASLSIVIKIISWVRDGFEKSNGTTQLTKSPMNAENPTISIEDSESVKIDTVEEDISTPNSKSKQQINYFLTKFVRVIVFIIGFLLVAVISELSKLIFPPSGINGAIRGGVGFWLVYKIWKNILPKINIGGKV